MMTEFINDAILVWPFDKAPPAYQALSQNGGDEDWLAFVPRQYEDQYIHWLQSPSFGCCDIAEHKVVNGTVYIGSHA